MVALLINSPEKGNGKTALCAGLGKYLQNEGKKVGYLTTGDDSDAAFIKEALSLGEADVSSAGGKGNIKEAYTKVSQGKDVVIIESDSQSAADTAKVLDAKVLVVEAYGGKKSDFNPGQSLVGVIINKVPVSRTGQERNDAGADVIGVLPEDRVLLSPTIGELAELIKGEVVRGAEQSAELVENVMLGAMVVDHGPEYFGRKDNKMVVLRSDRPDMQMAAMETSTKCLVITGDTPLKPVVMERAEEKNMPVIVVKDTSTEVIENIEGALGGGKLNQLNKLSKIVELIEQNIDMKQLKKGLGLSG